MQMNGLVLGKYRIEKLIDNGSFASVFRAREVLTNRTVAIKTLPKSTYPDARIRYLLTEFRAMGMHWGHPNIVSMHTVEPGDEEYVAYIVMEYVNGSSLYKLMTVKPPSPTWAINITLDICRGLMAAHERNIVHRDIKPQNILLTSDRRAKISDFGVACILETASAYAETVTGTRKYMAPEQYDGNYDYRADLYSTGLILYEMLNGIFPFQGSDHDEIKMQKQCSEPQFSNELPDALREVLQKALRRNVEKRYQTAADMYHALDCIRKNWYAESVQEAINTYANSTLRDTKLAEYREDLQLSTETAEKIERTIMDERQVTEDRRTRHELEVRVDQHYQRAIEHMNTAPEYVLMEMQQAHRLYLTDIESMTKADRIFRNLAETIKLPAPPSTAQDLIEQVDELPANEVLMLKEWFHDRFPPTESSDLYFSSLPPTTTSPPANLEQPESKKTSPEFILGKLHEMPRYPHENEAAEIYQLAKAYANRGKRRKARSEYRKLAEFYRKTARSFIKSQDWELGADCYSRAWSAYMAIRRSRPARQCAYDAAVYYSKFAEIFEKQQQWAEAGKYYTFSAEHYIHAESPKETDESQSHATVCYFNVAENARNEGNLEYAYDYCERTLAIVDEMQKASKAGTQARKLIEEIEALFTANLQYQPAQHTLPS